MDAKDKVLVLGACTAVGRQIALRLLHRTPLRLRLGNRAVDNARQLARSLADEGRSDGWSDRVEAIGVDVIEPRSLQRALVSVALVIDAVPARPEAETDALARAVIEAGADWIDLRFDPKQARIFDHLWPEIEAAGLRFIVGGGLYSGLPGAMARWAADRIPMIETARIFAFINPATGPTEAEGVDERMDVLRHDSAHVFRAGRWRSATVSDTQRVEFAFGVGPQIVYPINSDEMRRLSGEIETLRDTGLWIGGFNPITYHLATPLITAAERLLPTVRSATWRRLLGWSVRRFANPPFDSVVQVETIGAGGSQAPRLGLALRHSDVYALTACPVVATVEQWIREPGRPGVERMALWLDPNPLMTALDEMGVDIDIDDDAHLWDQPGGSVTVNTMPPPA